MSRSNVHQARSNFLRNRIMDPGFDHGITPFPDVEQKIIFSWCRNGSIDEAGFFASNAIIMAMLHWCSCFLPEDAEPKANRDDQHDVDSKDWKNPHWLKMKNPGNFGCVAVD